MTLADFIKENHITMTCKPTDKNPNIDDDMNMNHWICIFRRGRRRLTVPFSMGTALEREPTIDDVLDCLASDATTIENNSSFEEWCRELGSNPDSRKEERTYKACVAQSKKLKQFLGSAA